MGIIVTKPPSYKSIPFETTDAFSSINITNPTYNNGVPVVHQKSVHREYFRRVLKTTERSRVAPGGNAK